MMQVDRLRLSQAAHHARLRAPRAATALAVPQVLPALWGVSILLPQLPICKTGHSAQAAWRAGPATTHPATTG